MWNIKARLLKKLCHPQKLCHPREGGDPEYLSALDSRFRGNDSQLQYFVGNLKAKGAAAVEMIYVLCFFLAFLTVIERFSTMAASAHGLSVNLQNDVEKLMIDNGRPACLESIDPKFVKDAARIKVYGDRPVAKRLFFVTRPTCKEGT